MASPAKAKVFMSGRSQAVRIPAEYRFSTDEVFIRRDSQTGDLILSQAPGGWNEIFEALDKAEVTLSGVIGPQWRVGRGSGSDGW